MPKLSSIRLTKSVVAAAEAGACISDADVRGFRLMVTPKGAKRFVVQYRRKRGKQTTLTLGAYPTLTVEQARALAKARLAEVAAGADPVLERKEGRAAPTLNDLYKAYVEDYARTQALRPKTVKDARSCLQPALKALGRKAVADVTITDIRKLHGDVREAGLAAGNKGVYRANRMLAFLSKMFAISIERGWRTDNPCKGVKKFNEEQRWRNLSEQEVTRLFAACRTYLEAHERDSIAQGAVDAIHLLLFTGARLQEVLKAEWGQFDLERGLWEKPSSHTKTRRIHRLELDGPALDLLRQMKARASHPLYLFPGKPTFGGNVLGDVRPRADLKKPWARISEAAGLEGVRLHDLRRTNASFMLSGGASLATVGKTLGHTQASTTQRYAHLQGTVQRDAMRETGERLAALAAIKPSKNVVVLA